MTGDYGDQNSGQPPAPAPPPQTPPPPHVPPVDTTITQPGSTHPPAPGAQSAPLPETSPDGSITYTAAASQHVATSIGTGPSVEESIADSLESYTRAPTRPSPMRMGSAGRGETGVLGFLTRKSRGVVIGFAIFVLIGTIGFFFSRGTTSAGSVDPGDCFEVLEEGRVRSVTDQDCAEPHGSEVFAEVSGAGSDALDKCRAKFRDLDESTSFVFPEDTAFAVLEGTAIHSCIIESPSGQLVGSILE